MRLDLTENLIHLIRAKTDEEDYGKLQTILRERRLRGGTGKIKGGYKCVCFTETPLDLLGDGFVNMYGERRYSDFGIMVPKKWFSALGGRQVIYQRGEEVKVLPESHRWRQRPIRAC